MSASLTDIPLKKLAEAFYNDTYLFDQNACSAPHTIFWLQDEHLEAAKDRFWNAVHEHAEHKYRLQAVVSVDKITAFYRQAAYMDVKYEKMPDNVAVRSELVELPKNIEDFRCTLFDRWMRLLRSSPPSTRHWGITDLKRTNSLISFAAIV